MQREVFVHTNGLLVSFLESRWVNMWAYPSLVHNKHLRLNLDDKVHLVERLHWDHSML